MSMPRKVPYTRLGNSGLKVSKIILGTMQYGNKGWQDWVLGEDEALEHIKVAYEAGIQTFDTADTYSNGYSEVILGRVIKKLNLPRDEIVVMTKVFNVVGREYNTHQLGGRKDPDQNGYVNQHGLSRKHIFASVKKSLERLQMDYIDVLQCHRFDNETPMEETMQALHDVVQAGYVRYIGMSSCWAYQFQAMQNYAITNKLTPFISMQNHYSLLYREEEREMFPTLKMFGVGSIPWSPLARGALTRPLGQQTSRGQADWFIGNYAQASSYETIINRVEELAKKKDVTMAQIAIAWILTKEGVSAPIVGTTSIANLKDIIAGIDVKLTVEEIKFLEEEYKPTAVIGHF
ncbi:aryl-alcohol dehydrogenase [Suillus discolor]|uniref:Aryl-alcohol dehydrogenase n=1 Tax=Suillus discolor TaxID=1912936 RepID=A0A9P7F4P2_9AGAM|nr:aryl-alcohol dehydrogenase [Suillus discolor]KAG2107231.1 aryl-alcohol dehydrogenase [Suillus discolor]